MHEKEPVIELERVTPDRAEEYFALEQRLAGTKTYGTAETIEEAEQEIQESVLSFVVADGAVVGHVAYVMQSPESAYIASLAVLPEYRGRGIARKALQDGAFRAFVCAYGELDGPSGKHRGYLVV